MAPACEAGLFLFGSRAATREGLKHQQYQDMIILEAVVEAERPLEVGYLSRKDGQCPFLKWYYRQTDSLRADIDVRLYQVSKRNFGDHRRLKRGLVELRFKQGQGLRLYGGIWKDRFFLVAQGGFKPSQVEDIRIATELWLHFTKSQPNERRP